ncbi:TPA_asm: hypothetical protein [Porphyromonas phage phage029a_Kyudai3]|uniref:Uncharacterized protein n=1 Tax=Porphyromonas phage phage029a_Kyudai3 TaxID=3154119 RepID=A0AAT9JE63_9CAUD
MFFYSAVEIFPSNRPTKKPHAEALSRHGAEV